MSPRSGFQLDTEGVSVTTRRILEMCGLDQEEIDATGDAEAQAAEPTAVEIYRIHAGGEESLCERVDPDDFANGGGLVLVQRRWGGGKYRIRVKGADGRTIKTKTRRVEEPPAGTQQNGATPPSSRVEQLLEQLLRERTAPASGLPAGFLESVTAIATAMNSGKDALIGPLIQALTAKEARTDGESKVLDALLKGIKLGRESGSSDDGGFGATVRQLLPPALQALAGAGAREAAQPQQPEQPPEHEQPPQQPRRALPAENVPAWARVLAPHVPQLMQLAQMRADVEYWAEQIVSLVDGERLTFIEDQLQRGPAFRDDFYSRWPATMEYRSWFETFFDALGGELAAMREEDRDDDGDQEEGSTRH